MSTDININKKLSIKQINLVIDCADAGVLAEFYSKLLGWEWTYPHANGWAAITSPTGTVIAFQEVEEYEPPVWPWEKGSRDRCCISRCVSIIWTKAYSLP